MCVYLYFDGTIADFCVLSLIAKKIQKRLASLRNMLWSEEEKAMVGLAVGCLTYTSSGESDFSEDENGERHLTRYLVKKSPVERSR